MSERPPEAIENLSGRLICKVNTKDWELELEWANFLWAVSESWELELSLLPGGKSETGAPILKHRGASGAKVELEALRSSPELNSNVIDEILGGGAKI